LRGPRARDHRDSRYRRELQDAIVDCWQAHPRTGLSDGGTGLARCVCRSLPIASVVFALRRYVRPRNSAIIPATQQRIFFWLCSTAQPDGRLFDNRWRLQQRARPVSWFLHCRARCQRKRAGLGVRCVRTHGTPRCFWMSARDRLYAQSVFGRSGIGYGRQTLIIRDDDLGAVDHDHVGFLQLAELPADVRPGKTQVAAQLRLRKGEL